MSRSVNKILLIGNVGRDPELKETQSGAKVAHLSLATNYRMGANGDEEREKTDWHRLTLWNRLAVFAEDYVRKGDRVFVEGRLSYDSYDRDGVTIQRPRSPSGSLCCSRHRQDSATEAEEEL